jgi:hypothetical protein
MTVTVEQTKAMIGRELAQSEAQELVQAHLKALERIRRLELCAVKYLGWLDVTGDMMEALEKDLQNSQMVDDNDTN